MSHTNKESIMTYQMKPLGVDPGKLTGLSEKLIVSHYENNYTGAVKRLNAIRGQLAELDWGTTQGFLINGLKREELVAANSAVLHELYFDALGGDGVLPSCGLSVALTRDFGSVEQWRSEFTALAKAMGGGSGWAIMAWSAREGRLVNHWAADHTNLLAGATPVLALDMYEHAYQMDFGAKAAAYVDAFMRNIRWDAIYRRYGAAVAGDAVPLGVGISALDGGAPHVIDVRRAEDFAVAPDMVAGATWHDPATVDQWSDKIDATQPLFVYCMKGLDIGRSTALWLRGRGFDVRYLNGGIDAWREAGKPLQPKEVVS
ncbi:Superoxide dismutase [Mn] [Cupriavidus basilensis]|uniref:superoxide dismutase n=2 Tax=Cupriavidus basilensis TaxID=68895 RepID=A0A0C4YPU9_9BURK|nr:Superoxide dismutase [Mn] [Cupriavidus basilensis]